MAGILRRSFDRPDDAVDFTRGRAFVVVVGEEQVWRSELEPGWSWDEEIRPHTDGETSCQLTHREYVVAGRIRYLMEDGTEEVGSAGDFLFVGPGHRAFVEGNETCILIDW